MKDLFASATLAQLIALAVLGVWIVLRLSDVVQKACSHDPMFCFKALALMNLQSKWDLAIKCLLSYGVIYAACVDWHWSLVLALATFGLINTLLEFFIFDTFFMHRMAQVCRNWELSQGLTPTV